MRTPVLTKSDQLRLLLQRTPPRGQLFKWIGSKRTSAPEIVSYFPTSFATYIEPFVGGGAVLGTLAPTRAIAGDVLKTLIEVWRLVQTDPDQLVGHYRALWDRYVEDRKAVYVEVLASYNAHPNGPDLLFLSRTCYGGVVRFTKLGKMSTPLGAHRAIPPDELEARVLDWRARVVGTEFLTASFDETMPAAGRDDLVYCDPPYSFAQAILYGSQDFKLDTLWHCVEKAAAKGAKVALSLDGYKKSGSVKLDLGIPRGLFKRQMVIHRGGSMLKRFQRRDESVDDEHVGDRLLLTW